MSDLPEGVDLDTDEGFGAALAALAGGGEAPAVEEPAAQEESTPEGQPRDEQGRFAAEAPPAEVPQEGAASPAAQEESTTDPWADAPEALRSEYERVKREAAEAQSLIGRQGNELGTLRQEIEQVKARLETPATPTTPPPVPGTASPDVEAVEAMVSDQGGQAAMNWVANNRPDLIDATLEAWAIEDPVAAAAFAGRMAAYEAMQEYQPAAAPNNVEANFQQGMATVRSERSDWEAIKDHLNPALEEAPAIIRNNVMSEDAATQLEALRGLAEIARYRALAQATGQAIETRQAEAVAGKQAATVVSGSLRPAPERQPTGPDADKAEALKAFQDRILGAGVTSVLDALETG